MENKHIKWSTLPTQYVNVDTGEITPKPNKSYTIYKSKKHVQTNYNKTKGTIQWTIEYGKKQLTLFGD